MALFTSQMSLLLATSIAIMYIHSHISTCLFYHDLFRRGWQSFWWWLVNKRILTNRFLHDLAVNVVSVSASSSFTKIVRLAMAAYEFLCISENDTFLSYHFALLLWFCTSNCLRFIFICSYRAYEKSCWFELHLLTMWHDAKMFGHDTSWKITNWLLMSMGLFDGCCVACWQNDTSWHWRLSFSWLPCSLLEKWHLMKNNKMVII